MRKVNQSQQDPAEGSRKVIEKQLEREGQASRNSVEQDARGQFKQSRHGARNDGVSSADPRSLSGKKDGDATFPLRQDKGK